MEMSRKSSPTRSHSDGERAYMNWDRAIMTSTGRPVFLTDPFAEAYTG